MLKWSREIEAEFSHLNVTVEPTNGGHLRLNLPNGAFVFTGSTPSDHRVLKNLHSMVKRQLRGTEYEEIKPARKEKPMSITKAKMDEGIRVLAKLFPACFYETPTHRVPIKNGISRDIIKQNFPELNPYFHNIASVIERYTSHISYYYAVRAGAERVDLTGKPVGKVTLSEQRSAENRIAEFNKAKNEAAAREAAVQEAAVASRLSP
jgi:hypothetical protein